METISVDDKRPPKTLLKKIAAAQGLKVLLNTRNVIVREKGWSKNLPSLDEFYDVLKDEANVIKRPLLVNDKGEALLGFKPEDWKAFLKG